MRGNRAPGGPTGALESALHAAIDHAKCEGRISFDLDQGLHMACKLVYIALLL